LSTKSDSNPDFRPDITVSQVDGAGNGVGMMGTPLLSASACCCISLARLDIYMER
jgi:hypothetical protein